MARPRHDSTLKSAQERLEDAFWRLLVDRDYQRITVSDLVREAGVNRNTFYYHFSGLPELADRAIMHEVERTPFIPVSAPDEFDPRTAWRERIATLLRTPEQRRRLDRLALLAGPHSSTELLESLFDFGRRTLSAMLERDPERLDAKTDVMVDFAVGGLLAVLARWPSLSARLSEEDLLDEDIAVLAMGMYLSMSKEDMRAYWNRIFASE